MTAPAGSESQIGFGFEESSGIWQPAKLINFLRHASFSGFTAARQLVRSANMAAHNQTIKGASTRAILAPKIDFEPDVNSVPKLIAHFCGKDPTITNPSGTVYQWVNTPFESGDTAPATHIDTLFAEASDNDGAPNLVSAMRMMDLGIKVASGAISRVSAGFLACRDSYESDAVEVANTEFTAVPIIRGHRGSAFTGTINVEVTGAAGGGFDGTIKVEHGGTAQGSTDIDIVYGEWYPLVRSSNANRLGIDRYEELEICFPDGGTLTVGDEWEFEAVREAATASYSTLDVLHAAGAQILLGTEVLDVTDIDIKITRPLVQKWVVGSKYAKEIQKNGRWSVAISINRQRDDRDFLKKLISAESFALTVKMYGSPISGAYDELWQLSFPNCQVSVDQRDVATENVLPEKIDIVPFRSGSTDIFTSTIICTKATLAS